MDIEFNTRNIDEKHIAISHVWSDGTGAGLQKPGIVNGCLFDFFMDIATKLHCDGVWWDAISVPADRHARAKAMGHMARQYKNAHYTVVHDAHLLNFPWSQYIDGKENGGPCLALVLSSWFTRGWTAVELALSKNVKVLFKADNGLELVDLNHILASNPRTCTRGHWLLSQLIRRLWQPIDNVGDLLAVLSQRVTSWAKDRAEISAILAGVSLDYESESNTIEITKKTITHLGKIPHSCLLHGMSTIRETGGFSWCPGTMDNMPLDISFDMRRGIKAKKQSMLEVNGQGVAEGEWQCLRIDEQDVADHRVTQLVQDPAAAFQTGLALEYPEQCILLRPLGSHDGTAVLTRTYPRCELESRALSCRYVATVQTHQLQDKKWQYFTVRLGEEGLREPISSKRAIKELQRYLKSRNNIPNRGWIQRAHPRFGKRDEVRPRSFGSRSIQYVDQILSYKHRGRGKGDPVRFFDPSMEELGAVLQKSWQREAAARWILFRNPSLIPEMTSRLRRSAITPTQREDISGLLLKIIDSTEFLDHHVQSYKDLISIYKESYSSGEDGGSEFLSSMERKLITAKERSAKPNKVL